MRVDTTNFNGYKHQLKTLWRRGKLPKVVRGFYGDVLTQENISLEHLRPHSEGGKTNYMNLVLSSKEKNNLRGNNSIVRFADKQTVFNYLKQFIGVKVKDFNGNDYVQGIIITLRNLGFDIGGQAI